MLAEEIETQMAHSLDRDLYERIFSDYFERMGFISDHGWNDSFYAGFENNTFYIKSYHWEGCTCEVSGQKGIDCMTSPDQHDWECLLYKPNFIFKPDNFMLSWYKHPLRSNRCNQDKTVDQFRNMMEQCLQSIKGENKNVEI